MTNNTSKQIGGRRGFDFAMRSICDEYAGQRAMFVELLEALAPHASALDSTEIRMKSIAAVFDDLDPDDRKLVAEVFDNADPSMSTMGHLITTFSEKPWIGRLILAFKEQIDRPDRFPILMSGILTTAVSAFESHLAAVTAEFLREVPQALEATSKEKEFSLAELKAMGDIQDAIDVAISRRVDELLFGSFNEWRKFYSSNLNIEFRDLAIQWAEVEEVFQRRHVIVHNSGKASQRYVRALPSGSKVGVGDQLDIDEQYVLSAIDHLFVLGYLISHSVWRKLADSKHSTTVVLEQSYNLLVDSKFRVVQKLCAYGLGEPYNEGYANIFRVNLWLSKKALEGPESIRAEVEAWDVSALRDRFKLAKASLLGELDEVFTLLEKLSAADEISGQEMLEWPLLSTAREDPRFSRFMPQINASIANETGDLVMMNEGTRIFHVEGCSRIKAESASIARSLAIETGARPCRVCSAQDKA